MQVLGPIFILGGFSRIPKFLQQVWDELTRL